MLDKPLLDRIEQLSNRLGEAKSTVMRMAMRVGLDALEKAFEARPADVLSLVNKLESPKNLSSSSYPGHREEFSTAEGPDQKRKAK